MGIKDKKFVLRHYRGRTPIYNKSIVTEEELRGIGTSNIQPTLLVIFIVNIIN